MGVGRGTVCFFYIFFSLSDTYLGRVLNPQVVDIFASFHSVRKYNKFSWVFRFLFHLKTSVNMILYTSFRIDNRGKHLKFFCEWTGAVLRSWLWHLVLGCLTLFLALSSLVFPFSYVQCSEEREHMFCHKLLTFVCMTRPKRAQRGPREGNGVVHFGIRMFLLLLQTSLAHWLSLVRVRRSGGYSQNMWANEIVMKVKVVYTLLFLYNVWYTLMHNTSIHSVRLFSIWFNNGLQLSGYAWKI